MKENKTEKREKTINDIDRKVENYSTFVLIS